MLSRDPYKRPKESEMTKIVQEINSGIIGKRAACSKYLLCIGAVSSVLIRYFYFGLPVIGCQTGILDIMGIQRELYNRVF